MAKLAPMPSTVKVGPHVYRLERRPARQMVRIGGDRLNGCTDPDALLVTVVERLRRSKVQEIALHEFLHTLLPEFKADEEMVTALAPRLLQLLQENPGLVAYLTN